MEVAAFGARLLVTFLKDLLAEASARFNRWTSSLPSAPIPGNAATELGEALMQNLARAEFRPTAGLLTALTEISRGGPSDGERGGEQSFADHRSEWQVLPTPAVRSSPAC